jgi:hypothetical protein
MEKQLFTSIAGALLLLSSAGCAQLVNNSISSAPSRYLQVTHPVTDAVVLQLTLPNERGCEGMLTISKYENRDKDLMDLMACSSVSASRHLPFRATARNTAYDFLIDLEAVTLNECLSFIAGAKNGSNGKDYELVSDCKRKDKKG